MNVLKITSDNPDWCCDKTKADVEIEMDELGIPVFGDRDWIEYLIDRVFDGASVPFPRAVLDCLESFKNSRFKAEFVFDGANVSLKYDTFGDPENGEPR